MIIKKLHGVMAVLLVCAIVAFPSRVHAEYAEVHVLDLNNGRLDDYNAGDTLFVVGNRQLNAVGWETIRELTSKPFSLVFENGQTSIPDDAMKYNETLISITGEHVMTSVGESALYGCSELESVYLPGVTSVGKNAFRYCNKLELDRYSMPALKNVSETALADCVALETIYLPAATIVDFWAFYRSSYVWKVELPSVTYIGSRAFEGTDLEELHLGNADPDVHPDAFYGVSGLAVYSDRKTLKARDQNRFPDDTIYYMDTSGGGSGCDAISASALAANAGMYLILCAAILLKRKPSRS